MHPENACVERIPDEADPVTPTLHGGRPMTQVREPRQAPPNEERSFALLCADPSSSARCSEGTRSVFCAKRGSESSNNLSFLRKSLAYHRTYAKRRSNQRGCLAEHADPVLLGGAPARAGTGAATTIGGAAAARRAHRQAEVGAVIGPPAALGAHRARVLCIIAGLDGAISAHKLFLLCFLQALPAHLGSPKGTSTPMTSPIVLIERSR